MNLLRLAAVAAFASYAVPGAAQMVKAQDPQTLVRALQDAGYAAALGTDGVGDPMITSGVSGTNFRILFYNCTANRDCATVQFHQAYKVGTPIDLPKLNEWNSTKRFGRAYLDKDSDPVLAMDVDLDDGGVSAALFIDNVQFWASVLSQFERFIGHRS